MRRLVPHCLVVAFLSACGCGPEGSTAPREQGRESAPETPEAKPANARLRQRDELRAKLAQAEKVQVALDRAIASVEKDRHEIVANLQRRGVQAREDLDRPELKDDTDIGRLKAALLNNRQEFGRYWQQREDYDRLLVEGRLALRRFDRELELAAAGLSEQEFTDLTVMVRKIDERLNGPTSAADLLQADAVIAREFPPTKPVRPDGPPLPADTPRPEGLPAKVVVDRTDPPPSRTERPTTPEPPLERPAVADRWKDASQAELLRALRGECWVGNARDPDGYARSRRRLEVIHALRELPSRERVSAAAPLALAELLREEWFDDVRAAAMETHRVLQRASIEAHEEMRRSGR
jgi:hypothetical protein